VADAKVVCFTRLGADGNVIDGKDDGSAVEAAPSSSSSSNGIAAGVKRKAAGVIDGDGKAKEAKSDTCNWVGKFKDAEEHFKVCPYAGVRCSHDGCGALVARRDLPDHEQNCEHRQQLCKWAGCEARVAIDAVAAHESICVKREVGCPNDGCDANRIVFDELDTHRLTCQFESVACPFASVGCTASVPRKDVDTHEDAAMKQHNRLVLAKMCDMQQEVGTLKEEVAEYRKGVVVLKVTLKELAASKPTSLYSKVQVAGGRSFYLELKKKGTYYGVFLWPSDGCRLPCKVKCTFDIEHYDGNAASAKTKSMEHTYKSEEGQGYAQFIPQDSVPKKQHYILDIAYLHHHNNPYVKDNNVTFKCAFEVVK